MPSEICGLSVKAYHFRMSEKGTEKLICGMNRDVHLTSELALLIFMPLFQGITKGGEKC